jgi:hypothetical protein
MAAGAILPPRFFETGPDLSQVFAQRLPASPPPFKDVPNNLQRRSRARA